MRCTRSVSKTYKIALNSIIQEKNTEKSKSRIEFYVPERNYEMKLENQNPEKQFKNTKYISELKFQKKKQSGKIFQKWNSEMYFKGVFVISRKSLLRAILSFHSFHVNIG